AEFEKASQLLDDALRTLDPDLRGKLKHAGSVLKINQGDIYFPKPQVLQNFRTADRRYENAEKAVQCYWAAFDYLPQHMAQFSLAQALEKVGSSLWRATTPRDLYLAALHSLKRRVAGDFNTLYSVTLYYMLAICASKLPEHKAAAEVFLAQARHGLKE